MQSKAAPLLFGANRCRVLDGKPVAPGNTRRAAAVSILASMRTALLRKNRVILISPARLAPSLPTLTLRSQRQTAWRFGASCSLRPRLPAATSRSCKRPPFFPAAVAKPAKRPFHHDTPP